MPPAGTWALLAVHQESQFGRFFSPPSIERLSNIRRRHKSYECAPFLVEPITSVLILGKPHHNSCWELPCSPSQHLLLAYVTDHLLVVPTNYRKVDLYWYCSVVIVCSACASDRSCWVVGRGDRRLAPMVTTVQPFGHHEPIGTKQQPKSR